MQKHPKLKGCEPVHKDVQSLQMFRTHVLYDKKSRRQFY
ncbi:hypothetical protein EFW59_01726 [Bacillus subtilis]|nr:hypothetical protein EH5_01776 [Bacillus subtilis]RUS08598.1 hypothetical protein EFW59_01726 [Bacillus subtilis]